MSQSTQLLPSKLVPILGHPRVKVDLVNMKDWRVGENGRPVDMGPFTWTKLKRLSEGRNTMTAFLGPPRSGKSNAGSVDGENSSQNRAYRARDLTFLPYDYVKALKMAGIGDQVGFDETAAEYGNRDFGTIVNKMLNATHVTFGSRLVNVDWMLPVLKMQDLQARMLVNFVFVFKDSGMRGFSKLSKNWVNAYTGKIGRTGLGYCWWAKAWEGRPEEEKEYKEIKNQYQDRKYDKDLKEFAKADDENKDRAEYWTKKIQDALAKVRKDPKRYTNSRGNIDPTTIHNEFDLPMTRAKYVVTLFEREAN